MTRRKIKIQDIELSMDAGAKSPEDVNVFWKNKDGGYQRLNADGSAKGRPFIIGKTFDELLNQAGVEPGEELLPSWPERGQKDTPPYWRELSQYDLEREIMKIPVATDDTLDTARAQRRRKRHK